jgi:hypothetical protein
VAFLLYIEEGSYKGQGYHRAKSENGQQTGGVESAWRIEFRVVSDCPVGYFPLTEYGFLLLDEHIIGVS